MINRFYLEEIPVDLGSRVEVRDLVCRWLTTGEKSRQAVTLNAAIFMNAVANPRFKQLIQKADLVTVDGYGIFAGFEKTRPSNRTFSRGWNWPNNYWIIVSEKRFGLYLRGTNIAA